MQCHHIPFNITNILFLTGRNTSAQSGFALDSPIGTLQTFIKLKAAANLKFPPKKGQSLSTRTLYQRIGEMDVKGWSYGMKCMQSLIYMALLSACCRQSVRLLKVARKSEAKCLRVVADRCRLSRSRHSVYSYLSEGNRYADSMRHC